MRKIDYIHTKYKKDYSGCWNWTGSLDKDGYGRYGRGKKQYAHRAMWMHEKGEIPERKHLDHLCKNRKCVNPEHLEIVTPRENVLRSLSCKLDKGKAEFIRRIHQLGIPYNEISKRLKISKATISLIINNKRWVF